MTIELCLNVCGAAFPRSTGQRGSGPCLLYTSYLAVWLVVFTLLTILVFTVRARRIKAEKPTLMVWLEQHRLA